MQDSFAITFFPIMFVIILVGLFVLARRNAHTDKQSPDDYQVANRPLLSGREMEFFGRLHDAIGDAPAHICPQASIDAYLRFTGPGRFKIRGSYRARRSDFVLIDPDGVVILAVELDDSSHANTQEADAARDAVIRAAGIPTLRIKAGPLPTPNQIRTTLVKLRLPLQLS